MMQAALSDLFEAAVRDTAELLATLQEEFNALSKADAAMIEHVVSRKRELIASLEKESARRAAMLRAAGCGEDATGMQEWLRRSDNSADRQLERLWQEFTALLLRCQQQNQINGRVIDLGRRRVHDALCILRGTEPDPGIYDLRGSTQAAVASRPLTTA